MSLPGLFAELASDKRLGILQALKEGPLNFTKISEDFKMSSPETSRQLSRLTDVDIIEKRADGHYSLTNLGKLVLTSVSNLEFIADKSEYFLSHNISYIPTDMLRRLDSLSGGELVKGVYEILKIHEDNFQNVEKYGYHMTSDYPRHLMPLTEQKLDAGVEIKAIMPKDFLSKNKFQISKKVLEGIEFKALDEVKIDVFTTDVYSGLSLSDMDGKIDYDEVIIGFDKSLSDWCIELFDYYWERAEPYS